MAGRGPVVFKQGNKPTAHAEVGDFWIDPDRDNMCLQCTEVVIGDDGARNVTFRKLAPENVNVPPSETIGLKIVTSGISPERSIQLVVTDEDGFDHTVAEIMY